MRRHQEGARNISDRVWRKVLGEILDVVMAEVVGAGTWFHVISKLISRLLCLERVHSACCSKILEDFPNPDLLKKLSTFVIGGSVPLLVPSSMSYTFLQHSIV